MRTGFLLLLGLISWCSQAQVIHSIPLEIHKNIVFIKLTVNDVPSFTFMFDTGAGITVMNKSSVDGLGLLVGGKSSISTSGRKIEGITTVNNVISSGEISLETVEIDLIYLDHLTGYFGFKVDGIIGYDILRQLAVHVDTDAEIMAFYPSGYSPDNDLWTTVPLYEIEANHFALNVGIGTASDTITQILLKVDSGSGHYIDLFPQSGFDALDIIHSNKKTYGFGADSTITTNSTGKIRLLNLAGHEFKKVPVVLVQHELNLSATRKSQSQGLIGQQLLGEFDVIYDLPRKVAYFMILD